MSIPGFGQPNQAELKSKKGEKRSFFAEFFSYVSCSISPKVEQKHNFNNILIYRYLC